MYVCILTYINTYMYCIYVMIQSLVRMADVEQASWALQNLHLTTPENAPQPILVRFADSPEDKVVASHMVESGVHIFQSPHMLEGSMDIFERKLHST